MKKLIAAIVRGIMYVASKLPLRFHYFMGDVFAWLVKKVLRYRSGIVWMNLSRSFPECRYTALRDIYNNFYRHFGEIVAETIWFCCSSYKRLVKSGIVKVKNPEVLSEIYKKSPSVTLLCSHCGNWELLGGFTAYMEADGTPCPFTVEKLSVVYKTQANEVSDRVLAKNRLAPLPEKFPYCMIETQKILSGLKSIKKNLLRNRLLNLRWLRLA